MRLRTNILKLSGLEFLIHWRVVRLSVKKQQVSMGKESSNEIACVQETDNNAAINSLRAIVC